MIPLQRETTSHERLSYFADSGWLCSSEVISATGRTNMAKRERLTHCAKSTDRKVKNVCLLLVGQKIHIAIFCDSFWMIKSG